MWYNGISCWFVSLGCFSLQPPLCISMLNCLATEWVIAMRSFVRQTNRELIDFTRELIGDDSGSGRRLVETQSWNCVGKLVLLSRRRCLFWRRRSSRVTATVDFWRCYRRRKEPSTAEWTVVDASSLLDLPLLCQRADVAGNFSPLLSSSQGTDGYYTVLGTVSLTCIVFCTRGSVR